MGDLTDEDEEEKPEEIRQVSENVWNIQGVTPLDDVEEALNIKLPVDEYDTFGGYIFGNLGAIPADGSQFELEADGLRIKVIEVKEHRIEGTVVERLPEKKETEE